MNSPAPPRKTRTYIRHPADIPIHLTVEGSTDGENELKNVSLGGLCFMTDNAVEVGSKVLVKMPVVSPPFETAGKVAWCRRREEDYEVGIQFMGAKDLFRVRMVEQICFIEHYKNEMLETRGRELTTEQAAAEWIEKYGADFPEPEPGGQPS